MTLRQAFAAALLVLSAGSSAAQQEMFAGKTITIYVGYTAGGSYDLYGRLAARHLGAHLPGHPAVVVQNMPGAGSLKAANYLYEVAPRDGTALGVVVESTALEQALANPAAQYDAAKFTYVGRLATSNNVFMMWHTAKVQSLEDAKRATALLAGTGPGSIAETIPRLTNALMARSRTAAGTLSVLSMSCATAAPGSGSSSTSSLRTSAMKSASFTIASKPSRSAATRSAAMPGGPIKDRPIALPLA